MADEIITRQQLVDASIDADSLQLFISGSDFEDVLTRLGQQYPTLAKMIRILMETGGWKAYETEAILLATTPTANPSVGYAFDTKKMYLWNGSEWSDEGLSQLDQARADIDAKVEQVPGGIYTHKFVDADNNIMMLIYEDGSLRAVGLDGSVQEEILNAKGIAQTASSSLQLRIPSQIDPVFTHKFVDTNGNVMASIDVEGGFYLVGIDGSLQEYLGKNSTGGIAITKDTSLAMLRSKRDVFTEDTQQVLDMQRYAGINAAPTPMDLHKRVFTLNDTWLDLIRFNKPSNKTPIRTPYRADDGVVHPNIIEFYNGFRGYRYLMKLEPYYDTQEAFENPCVYGSNDLVNFDLLDGFKQPLADRPVHEFGTAHNSDGVFTYDPRTGDLILVWRETWRNYLNTGSTYDALAMRKTKDGYEWSEKEYLLEPRVNGIGFNTASPGILYDPINDEWHIYIGTGNSVQHYVKKELNKENWQLPETITTPNGFAPWHLDVRFVGNKVVMLVHDLTNGGFRFGVSSDFVNFTWAASSNYTENGTDMYKATFLPKINSLNQLSFIVILTTRQENADITKRWNLLVTQSNYVDAGVEFI